MTAPRVGLVGCGRIAEEAHLPAYSAAGVEVVAVCDVLPARADRMAKRFAVPTVSESADQLMRLPQVELIDVATPPGGRAELIATLLESGKPLLIQKPLAYDLSEAQEICERIARSGVPAAINHNARWMPVQVRLQNWIAEGRLGDIYAIHHLNRYSEDVVAWYTEHPDYLFVDHGLHYLDLARQIAGCSPEAVSARAVHAPGQVARCPLAYSVHLRWGGRRDLLAALYFNNAVPSPDAFECLWHVDGSRGSARTTLDSVGLIARDGVAWPMETLPGGWVPDGFIGAYTALARAVECGDTPPHNPGDHLKSLALATSAAASARLDGAWIDLPEVETC